MLSRGSASVQSTTSCAGSSRRKVSRNEMSRTPVIRRTPPEPLPNDGVRTVVIGTILWTVALVVLLPFWSRLEDAGRLWWIPTCAVAVGLGLLGLLYCTRRAAAMRRAGANPGSSD
jgi:hypothetical protein